MGKYDDIIKGNHSIIRKISNIFLYFSGSQRLFKIIIIDERVSGIIEEDHAVFHFIESVFIDHPLCISDSRNMNGYVITVGI